MLPTPPLARVSVIDPHIRPRGAAPAKPLVVDLHSMPSASPPSVGDAEEDEEHLLVVGGRWIKKHPDDGQGVCTPRSRKVYMQDELKGVRHLLNQNLKLKRQCKKAKKLYELAIRLEFGFLGVAVAL
ncbi:uncharacterized protein [Miscanthus floridulus]|uniref:uncharacterized protein isoform X2 n=1 Tax=Miscanthus floridulus TaxID=154761 RepID=UPI003458631A